MNQLLAVVIIGMCGLAGCQAVRDVPSPLTDHQDKQQLCGWLIASDRSILESMFEVELYNASYETDEWHTAIKTLEVATSDANGRPLTPRVVLPATIDKLVQVKNANDRMRLEYMLFGSRISLEERRRFDDYCVPGMSLVTSKASQTQ